MKFIVLVLKFFDTYLLIYNFEFDAKKNLEKAHHHFSQLISKKKNKFSKYIKPNKLLGVLFKN